MNVYNDIHDKLQAIVKEIVVICSIADDLIFN